MEKYEQLEFEITKKLGHSDNLEQRCFDNNGDEIKIGDSVVAVRGEAKLNCVEGIVKNIIHYYIGKGLIKRVSRGVDKRLKV